MAIPHDQWSRAIRRRALISGSLGTVGVLLVACGSTPPSPTASAPTAAARATSVTPVATRPSAAPTAPGALPTTKPAATTQPVAASGKLTLTTDVNVEGIPLANQVADNWNKANPATPLAAQTITSSDYVAKILTMAAGGVLSDVFALNGTDVPNFANRKVTLTLDSSIKQDAYALSDFLPLPLERMRWKGATIAMPRGFSNQWRCSSRRSPRQSPTVRPSSPGISR